MSDIMVAVNELTLYAVKHGYIVLYFLLSRPSFDSEDIIVD
jgi:hypothetical protein